MLHCFIQSVGVYERICNGNHFNIFDCFFINKNRCEIFYRSIICCRNSYTDYTSNLTVLNNQIPSLFFIVLAIWLNFSNDCKKLKFFRFILAGIFLQISNILRPEAIIIIVALAAYLIFEIFKTPTKTKDLILSGMLLGVCYVLLGVLADFLVRKTGLSSVGLKNMMPGWKFILGLNYETNGKWSGEMWDTVVDTLKDGIYVTDKTVALQNQIIIDALSQPLKLIKLFFKKVYSLWDESPLYWCLSGTVSDGIHSKLAVLNKGLFCFSFVFSSVGLISQVRNKIITSEKLVFWFIPFAFTAVMLFVEIQSRYTYIALPFVIASSAFGFECILEKLKQKSLCNSLRKNGI